MENDRISPRSAQALKFQSAVFDWRIHCCAIRRAENGAGVLGAREEPVDAAREIGRFQDQRQAELVDTGFQFRGGRNQAAFRDRDAALESGPVQAVLLDHALERLGRRNEEREAVRPELLRASGDVLRIGVVRVEDHPARRVRDQEWDILGIVRRDGADDSPRQILRAEADGPGRAGQGHHRDTETAQFLYDRDLRELVGIADDGGRSIDVVGPACPALRHSKFLLHGTSYRNRSFRLFDPGGGLRGGVAGAVRGGGGVLEIPSLGHKAGDHPQVAADL